MIRAVLDTNVLVAALLSRTGAPARLMRDLEDGLFDAIVCARLLAELRGVLQRPKIARHIDDATAQEFVAWLERIAVVVPDPEAVARISPDPDDDYLIALTRIGRAQAIVSGDAHLLGIAGLEPRALSPAQFAALVEGLG
ncbi:MAG: putative toxin-antitoxin system toxin component, PIN family [Coriobacteriia bacterium]|nr:putative toxin-antitoxin system toxin component, PIN family [Coriobacteriia bacterium]